MSTNNEVGEDLRLTSDTEVGCQTSAVSAKLRLSCDRQTDRTAGAPLPGDQAGFLEAQAQ